MKRYKLLRDLPTFKAGQLAYISKTGNLIAGTPENQETTDTGLILMIYHETTLKKFPGILTEWFEEIQEEPTDSIHWKPVIGEEYWSFHSDGGTSHNFCTGCYWDTARYKMGRTYRTEEECIRARNRELAEVRLRRTSTFKPEFKRNMGGYTVYYDPHRKRLGCAKNAYFDSGEPVRYETREDARKSIEENEKDWLIYFGVDPSDTYKS